MLPSFLRLLINEPALLTEHIEAYSSLLTDELRVWKANLQRQWVLKIIMACSFLLTIMFAGIALMLWGVTDKHHWSLIIVPLIPFLVSIAVAFILTNKSLVRTPFEASKKQFCADIHMFTEGT